MHSYVFVFVQEEKKNEKKKKCESFLTHISEMVYAIFF